jgi:haloacid dehalogenase-like hydrolase
LSWRRAAKPHSACCASTASKRRSSRSLWSFAVDWFAHRLGADYAHGTRLGPHGIEHVWPADKGPWLEALIERLSLERAAVAAVGDSDGDRELLEAAGLRFFVGDRPPNLPGLVHLPRGDMLEIARRIVDENGG